MFELDCCLHAVCIVNSETHSGSLHRFAAKLQTLTSDFGSFTGFLSWFRNGLLATGIGVIAFAQSEVGREAGYCTASNALSFKYSRAANKPNSSLRCNSKQLFVIQL